MRVADQDQDFKKKSTLFLSVDLLSDLLESVVNGYLLVDVDVKSAIYRAVRVSFSQSNMSV